MNRNVYGLLSLSILVGTILILLGSILRNTSLVPIGASLLSGSIVGIVVSYSQSHISADVSENLRIRAERLNDYKSLVKRLENKDQTDRLARIFIAPAGANYSAEDAKFIHLLKESNQHW